MFNQRNERLPQRHSKNNNDLAFFTYDEKRKLGYGTQKERLGRDSIKPFDACCLCLKPFIDPLCCQKGHVFCKECILECLLAQKKDIQSYPTELCLFSLDFFLCIQEGDECDIALGVYSWNLVMRKHSSEMQVTGSVLLTYLCRKLAAHAAQLKQEKEEEEERLTLQKARELDAFDQQNHGAVPQYSDKNHTRDKNGFHGANSVKVTSYEEEALRNMKAFWLPSATPEAPVKVEAPSTSTVCPEGNEKLKLKTLFPIHLTEDRTLSSCGHVFCKKCADKFMAVDKVCLVCNKGCKDRNLVPWKREEQALPAMGIIWKQQTLSIWEVVQGWGCITPSWHDLLDNAAHPHPSLPPRPAAWLRFNGMLTKPTLISDSPAQGRLATARQLTRKRLVGERGKRKAPANGGDGGGEERRDGGGGRGAEAAGGSGGAGLRHVVLHGWHCRRRASGPNLTTMGMVMMKIVGNLGAFSGCGKVNFLIALRIVASLFKLLGQSLCFSASSLELPFLVLS
ncbi:E3 ubiquitin-protein ligase CSU1 [Vitis vinifera]|uniref:E3 ubiquitin-protein ligase CSU1 n=1 Tax=Vitis vinifera TaxID=29760 RepID=A0A438BS85_VITVI|nr:E3 ubiquitin-protein ligase CSU1 [Vitis vinifera]